MLGNRKQYYNVMLPVWEHCHRSCQPFLKESVGFVALTNSSGYPPAAWVGMVGVKSNKSTNCYVNLPEKAQYLR